MFFFHRLYLSAFLWPRGFSTMTLVAFCTLFISLGTIVLPWLCWPVRFLCQVLRWDVPIFLADDGGSCGYFIRNQHWHVSLCLRQYYISACDGYVLIFHVRWLCHVRRFGFNARDFPQGGNLVFWYSSSFPDLWLVFASYSVYRNFVVLGKFPLRMECGDDDPQNSFFFGYCLN